VTLACHWEPPDAAASSATFAGCQSRKVSFSTPSEAYWWLTSRGNGVLKARVVYRCPACSQYHFSSQTPVERKRTIKATRKRSRLTGAPSPSEPETT
jgi:hypothetical protein